MINKRCNGCGKTYQVHNHRAKTSKYCSKKCMNTRVQKSCQYCGKSFEVKYYRSSIAKFCSISCSSKFYQEQTHKTKEYKGMIWVECSYCGLQFLRWRHEVREKKYHFCSVDCRKKGWSLVVKKSEDHPNWKGAKKKKICEECGKEFEYYPSVRPDAKYCSKKCLSKAMKIKMRGPGTYSSRHCATQQSRKRFPNECAICGWNEGRCDSHHIIAVSDNGSHSLDNIIMLCPNHHRLARENKISIKYLQKLRKTLYN